MIKHLATRIFLIVPLLLTNSVLGQGQQSQAKEFVGEGFIVAIQKKTRLPVKPEPGGIATFVELWIVKINDWADHQNKFGKYVLVSYHLNERGFSDIEINSTKLRFTLRERREDEHTDCLWTIIEGNTPPYKERAVRLSDYVRTEPGRLEVIPALKSLPCLIADRPPVVVE
jgi:hypothetical protein